MKNIAIIGYGRFGALLAGLCAEDFNVHIVEQNDERKELAKSDGHKLISFESLIDMDFVFLAVPISAFEEVVQKLASFVGERQVIIDLCSVKVYPSRLMQKYLVKSQLLGTHPMFGPDSASDGLDGLQVALCPLSIDSENLEIIEAFWKDKGVTVISTTPEDHDKDAVYSQAFSYSIANLLLNMSLKPIQLKTRSYEALSEVAALSANDSKQLFHDMLFYNPYFSEMKQELKTAMAKTASILDAIETEQDALKRV